MPNLLIPELWKGQCAEWSPALPGVALRAGSAGSCLLQFQQALGQLGIQRCWDDIWSWPVLHDITLAGRKDIPHSTE